ncbi:MAG TPA: sigma factor-like helix-turn-helix DNA-binding protein [Caulobacteraceae bacterium]|nr:sigma factor-like helix-turn-helix DNA-binding protein [Caulobacteraceae bacterium]
MTERMSDEAARTLRRLWFAFLDEVEPARPRLHAYCLRLTGSIFDAEDLVQETLLRAFGAIGQGDLSGGVSPIGNARAYLARAATNVWIDGQRRSGRQTPVDENPVSDPTVVTPAAARALFEHTAPQERAAVVLKDVFDFSLEEVATILATSVGAVKSALHRARGKLAQATVSAATSRGAPAPPELVDRFIAAFNARDLKALTAVLSEDVAYEARGVGGERGQGAIWIEVNLGRPANVAWERAVVDGETVAIGVVTSRSGRRLLAGVSRLEASDGRITRHVGYFFCPETLRLVAERLGLEPADHGYHQDPETLQRMIADARSPWRGP